MEFERQQFLLYSFVVRRLRWLLWAVLVAALALLTLSTGLRLHYAASRDTSYVGNCLDAYLEHYKQENNSLLAPDQLMRIELILNVSEPVYQEAECLLSEVESNTTSKVELRLFEEAAVEFLPNEVKKSIGVQTIYITLAMGRLAGEAVGWWFGRETILLDQLAEHVQRRNLTKFYISDNTNRNYMFDMKSEPQRGVALGVLHRLSNVCTSAGIVLMVSVFCGVLVTLFNIFLNALLTPIVEFFRRCGVWQVASFVSNPIEEHLALLRGNSRHFLLDKYVMVAFLGVSYLLYVGLKHFLRLVMPYIFRLYGFQANLNSFIMVCIIEELSILFFRTRTSIKMAPTIILTIHIISMYIRQIYEFAIPQYWAYTAFWLSLAFTMATVLFVETAVAEGSDDNLSKPTAERPRVCYFPSYNLGWHWSLPPLWTVFVKVHSREFFSQGQLSYVDRNYDMLYAQLTGLAGAAGHPVHIPAEQLDDLAMM